MYLPTFLLLSELQLEEKLQESKSVVDGFLTSEESERSNATLYIVYLRSGTDEEGSKTFADGENLITLWNFSQ